MSKEKTSINISGPVGGDAKINNGGSWNETNSVRHETTQTTSGFGSTRLIIVVICGILLASGLVSVADLYNLWSVLP